MFTFHKPKVFRSANGCCICRAKSSSSRFTDSQRYESTFSQCFLLDEIRTGEICNACVLLVKRFQKLPKGSKKDWSHVVDARSGPGIKSKTRKVAAASSLEKENNNSSELCETPEKVLKRKHVYRRRGKQATPKPLKKLIERKQIEVSSFLDMSFWKKEEVCCGIIFRGPYGEVALDRRFYRPCHLHSKNNNNNSDNLNNNMAEAKMKAAAALAIGGDRDDSFMEEEEDEEEELLEEESSFQRAARRLSEQAAAGKAAEKAAEKVSSGASATASVAGENDDEGFFDRPAVSPEGSGDSAATPPPTNVDDEMDEDEEEIDDDEDSGGSSNESG